MTETETKEKQEQGLSRKVIIIGEPGTDLTRKLAQNPGVDVVDENTTITEILKKQINCLTYYII